VKLSSAASLGFSKVSKDTLGLYPGTGVEPPVSVLWIVGCGEKVCEWFGDAGTSWTCGGLKGVTAAEGGRGDDGSEPR